MIVHHHLIFQAKIQRDASIINASENVLKQFLLDLIEEIDMELLIPPVLKFSDQKAWTGLVGIITSHMSFHFWTVEKYVQLDIYSCKEFNLEKTVKFLNKFWEADSNKVLFLKRNESEDFESKNFTNLGL